MKLIYRSLLILVIFAGFTSCDDEPIGESYGGGISENSQFQVDIDGETFFADISGMLTEEGKTQIVGKRNDGHKVVINIEGAGTGDYILDGTPDGEAFYYNGTTEPYSMEGIDTIGIVSITQYDVSSGLASGTFSFRAAGSSSILDTTSTDSIPTPIVTNDTLEFTNGEFTNISLHTDIAPPPDSENSNFHVELDGVLYNANNIQSSLTSSNGLVISTTNGIQNLKLQVFDPQIGTFNLSENTNEESMIVYNTDQSTNFTSTQGSVNITNIDQDNHKVSGTFSGTLSDLNNPDSTITMTNGVFENVSYSSDENISSNSIDAHIGNDDFNSSEVTIVDAENGVVNVMGTDQSGNELQLNLPVNATTGNYPVTVDGNYSAIYTKNDADTGVTTEYTTFANSGSFTIESNQGNTMSGSFTFSVRNENGEVLQVTDGHFNVEI